INAASHEHKEAIKVGYNLRRKVVLMTIWFLSPLVVYFNPSFFGIFEPHATAAVFWDHVAIVWLAIAIDGLPSRDIQLSFLKDVRSGLTWLPKTIPDPVHDVMLYHRAPLYLMRGELIDPMPHVQQTEDPASGGELLPQRRQS